VVIIPVLNSYLKANVRLAIASKPMIATAVRPTVCRAGGFVQVGLPEKWVPVLTRRV